MDSFLSAVAARARRADSVSGMTLPASRIIINSEYGPDGTVVRLAQMPSDCVGILLSLLSLRHHGAIAAVCRGWRDASREILNPTLPARWACGRAVATTIANVGGELALSSDGSTMVSVGWCHNEFACAVHSLRVGAASLTPQPPLVGHERSICCVAIDGDCVVSGADGGEVRVWSLSEGGSGGGRRLPVTKADGTASCANVYALALADGILLAGCDDGLVFSWACATPLHTDTRGALQGWVMEGRARSGKALGGDMGLEEVGEVGGLSGAEAVNCVGFCTHPAGGVGLLDGGQYKSVVLRAYGSWSDEPIDAAEELAACRSSKPPHAACTLYPVPSSKPPHAAGWTGGALLMRHPAEVLGIAVDGELLVTSCADGKLRTFSLAEWGRERRGRERHGRGICSAGTCTRILSGHEMTHVFDVALRGPLLASAGFDGTVRLWELLPFWQAEELADGLPGGQASGDKAAGDVPRDEAAGDVPRDEAAGDVPRDDAAGDVPRDEAAGAARRDITRGWRPVATLRHITPPAQCGPDEGWDGRGGGGDGGEGEHGVGGDTVEDSRLSDDALRVTLPVASSHVVSSQVESSQVESSGVKSRVVLPVESVAIGVDGSVFSGSYDPDLMLVWRPPACAAHGLYL